MAEDRKESYRSPVFTMEEINALVNIIERYKNIVLNKSTTTAASHIKDKAWNAITKVFNKQGFKHTRSVECIKNKWNNLKNVTKNTTKNNTVKPYDNDLCSRVVTMLLETENSENTRLSLESELNEINAKDAEIAPVMVYDNCEDEESDSSDGEMQTTKSNRSLNFLPHECNLLLKCVREERNNVFIKETTARANVLKNSAWERIAKSFNKQSPQKRSSRVLRTKFTNMKRRAKSAHTKQFLSNDLDTIQDNEEIKTEPMFDSKTDSDTNEENLNDNIDTENLISSNKNYLNIDPLDTVINGDCRIGTKLPFNPCCTHDSKQVEQLQLQLLNYQLETAKMERKRVENAMQAEELAFESNAVERSLRLRAARLEVIAAQAKFAANHPALGYIEEEKLAQQYLEPYNRT